MAEFISKSFKVKQTTPKTGAVHISHSIENGVIKLTKKSLISKRTTPKHDVALAENLSKHIPHIIEKNVIELKNQRVLMKIKRTTPKTVVAETVTKVPRKRISHVIDKDMVELSKLKLKV